ncbi:DUF3429 domain-containing protein [Pseudooceanicola sp. MF1-13]|uniref:DUF3429 domain-containing protein n=1 Tax=Pseudooceanicola sp. MF1-13 TaxID=3379095 RepID=UPI0038920FD7
MMRPVLGIPLAPLALGVAGLIPFIAGALLRLGVISTVPLMPGELATDGAALILGYGTIILAFMSGILWGFATKSDDPMLYALSVVPALWGFLNNGEGSDSLIWLMTGFILLWLLEFVYIRRNLTPEWWRRMRSGLQFIVLICIYLGTMSPPTP